MAYFACPVYRITRKDEVLVWSKCISGLFVKQTNAVVDFLSRLDKNEPTIEIFDELLKGKLVLCDSFG